MNWTIQNLTDRESKPQILHYSSQFNTATVYRSVWGVDTLARKALSCTPICKVAHQVLSNGWLRLFEHGGALLA
jgi:hypothetical protein